MHRYRCIQRERDLIHTHTYPHTHTHTQTCIAGMGNMSAAQIQQAKMMMENPGMMQNAVNMMKNMDPATLANMFNMQHGTTHWTPEMAKQVCLHSLFLSLSSLTPLSLLSLSLCLSLFSFSSSLSPSLPPDVYSVRTLPHRR